jgi:TM2 domain-containing membrane protein YozV
MLDKPKNRTIATLLAVFGIFTPIVGLHKFYLGQSWWGAIYLLLSWTPIPHVACAIEAVWYLLQDSSDFQSNFDPRPLSLNLLEFRKADSSNNLTAETLRQLEQLRQEGLVSEYEFEQKRRQWLDKII